MTTKALSSTAYENKVLIVRLPFGGKWDGMECLHKIDADGGERYLVAKTITSENYGSNNFTNLFGAKLPMWGMEHPGGFDKITMQSIFLNYYTTTTTLTGRFVTTRDYFGTTTRYEPAALSTGTAVTVTDSSIYKFDSFNFQKGRVYGFCFTKNEEGLYSVTLFSPYKYDENFINENGFITCLDTDRL
jgi:hypothetical protein